MEVVSGMMHGGKCYARADAMWGTYHEFGTALEAVGERPPRLLGRNDHG